MPGRRPRVAGARPAPAPPADAGRRQAPAPAREPGAAAPRGLRGPPLDRRRDPGVARQPGRESAGARILLLVNYRPEYQHGWGGKTYYTQLRLDPLPPESAEELLHGPPRRRSACSRSSASRSSEPRATRSSSRRASGRSSRRGPGRRARRLSSRAAGRERSRSRRRCRRSWRRGSTGCRPRRSGCSSGGRDRQGRALVLLRAIAERAEETLPRASRTSRRPSSSTRRALPRPRVHLQARPDPRGGLRQPAPRAPPRAPRADRRGHRAPLSRPSGRAGRAARPPRVRGEVWEKALHVSAVRPAPRRRHVGLPQAARCFEQALVALERTCPRAARRYEQGIDLGSSSAAAAGRSAKSGGLCEHLREAEASPGRRRPRRSAGCVGALVTMATRSRRAGRRARARRPSAWRSPRARRFSASHRARAATGRCPGRLRVAYRRATGNLSCDRRAALRVDGVSDCGRPESLRAYRDPGWP